MKKFLIAFMLVSSVASAQQYQYQQQSGWSNQIGNTRFYYYQDGTTGSSTTTSGVTFYNDSSGKNCITNNVNGASFTTCN